MQLLAKCVCSDDSWDTHLAYVADTKQLLQYKAANVACSQDIVMRLSGLAIV